MKYRDWVIPWGLSIEEPDWATWSKNINIWGKKCVEIRSALGCGIENIINPLFSKISSLVPSSEWAANLNLNELNYNKWIHMPNLAWSKYCSNRKRSSQWDLLQWQPEVPGNVVFINT